MFSISYLANDFFLWSAFVFMILFIYFEDDPRDSLFFPRLSLSCIAISSLLIFSEWMPCARNTKRWILWMEPKSILLLSAIFRKMMNHIQSRIFNLHPARNTKELHVVVVTHLTLFCFHQASRWRERSLGTPPLFRSCLGAFLTSFPLCSDARLSYIGESFSLVCYSSSWARRIVMKWASW